MRLPGRLSAAIEILEDIERRHRPVAEALKAWGLNNRFAGAGDRAAIGNLVYDALRRRASHAYAMGSDAPRALVLTVAVRDWGISPEELADLFATDGHAPEALSADEVARLVAADPLEGAPDHVRAERARMGGGVAGAQFWRVLGRRGRGDDRAAAARSARQHAAQRPRAGAKRAGAVRRSADGARAARAAHRRRHARQPHAQRPGG